MFSGVQLISLSFLLIKTLAVTTLTTNNCPNTFDPIASNITVSSSTQETVELFYGGIYSSSDQAVLQQSFSQGDTATVNSYILNMQILYPFIIIAIAFATTYIISVCCCIFQKSCPPCQSWKRDFSKNPYDKKEIKCTTIFTVSFAVGILIVAILGVIFYPNLQEEVIIIKCSLFYALDVALNGDVNNNWGGFSQMATKSSNISSLLSAAGSAATSSFGSSNTLTASLAALRQQNINIYNNNYQSTVYSPNHVPSVPFTPYFISNDLGPYSVNTTMTGDIQTAIKQTELVTTQGSQVFSSSQIFANSVNNIQAKYQSSIQSMTSSYTYLNSAVVSVSNFSEKVFDEFFPQLLYFIQGVLGIIIVSSIFVLLGSLSTHYFQIRECKICVHIGWLFYGLMYFGIIALCFAFFAIGGVSYSFCKFYGGLIQNQTQLNAFSATTKSTAFNRIFQTLSPCFYANGSISSTYSLGNQLTTISTFYSQINTYLNMQDSTKSTFIDLNGTINKINSWLGVLEKYRTGIYNDAPTGVTTEDNPNVAIQNMNKLTNNDTASPYPTCTYDYWVFDATNCSHNSTESIYVSSTTTSGTTFSTTGFMCISFNEKFSSSSTTIWSESDIINRYRARRNCSNNTQTFDNLLPYVSSLISYRDSRINLYQSLKDQLTSLLSTNNALNSQISAYTSNIVTFNANTSFLNSLMTNSINGINYTSNCSVVADNLRLVYNVFCVNFVYKSIQLGICCLVLLGIMIGGMLTGSVFAIRYNRIDKDPKVFLNETPIILQDELSAKKEDSSDTSSSSSDD